MQDLIGNFAIFAQNRYMGRKVLKRVNFPRRDALIFCAHLQNVIAQLIPSANASGKEKHCIKLCQSLTVISESVKNREGIEAFVSILETVAFFLRDLTAANARITALLNDNTTLRNQIIALNETVTALENLAEIRNGYQGEVLADEDVVGEDLSRIMSKLSTLISTGSLRCIVAVSQGTDSNGEPYIAVHSDSPGSAEFTRELSNIQAFTGTYRLEPQSVHTIKELSLSADTLADDVEEDHVQLSTSMTMNYWLTCCLQFPVKLGMPIFCTQQLQNGQSSVSVGTLGCVVQGKDTSEYYLITAAHVCRRNMHIQYLLYWGVGAVENNKWKENHLDITVSNLPTTFKPDDHTNSVAGTYTALDNTTEELRDCCVTKFNSRVKSDMVVYFKGVYNSGKGIIKGSVYYYGISHITCQFSVGTHGDSGALVFRMKDNGECVAVGILVAALAAPSKNYSHIVAPLLSLQEREKFVFPGDIFEYAPHSSDSLEETYE